jgi:hypothetical protein
MQAARLAALARIYRPQGVLWLLNDTDGADDRLACALLRDPAAPAEKLEFANDDFELSGASAWLARLAGQSPFGRHVRQSFYPKRWLELVRGERARRCEPCRGVREVVRVAREGKIPLIAAYLPAGARRPEALYESEPSPRTELLACLAQEGVRLAPLSFAGIAPEQLDTLYWENDFHLSPEGIQVVADELLPVIAKWLGEHR